MTDNAGHWHRRAFCKCGRDLGQPSFGDLWFTRQDHPVCPDCGGSSYGYMMKTVRKVYHGWFKPTTYEEKTDEPVNAA